MRYCIKLSYNGRDFCGWQTQPDAKTIQECLEKALSTLLNSPVAVTGAGRTDSGVNAISYVAHFDAPGEACLDTCGEGQLGSCDEGQLGSCDEGQLESCGKAPGNVIDTAQISYKLNAMLPSPIVIHSISPADRDFHARFDAKQRKYTYFLHKYKDPFVENFSYRCPWSLDVEKMNRAASLLIGRHDFSCFEKSGTDTKTSICTVTEAYWSPYVPTHVSLMGFGLPAGCGESGKRGNDAYLYFRVSADRFLRNMVRALVGTLIDVGRGKRSVEEFGKLILAETGGEKVCRRSSAGESVPGHALFLSGIDY